MVLVRFLIVILLFIFPFESFSFVVSKPNVFYDKSESNVIVMLFLENLPTSKISEILKKNLEVTLFVDVKLIRKDFGILNIQTEITNVSFYYKITYDFTTESYVIFNNHLFRTFKSLESMFDTLFYPLLVRISLLSLRNNPDFTEIYEDTEFFIASRARIVYMNVKPPLNIIASLLGIRNYETGISFSDVFFIK